MTRRIPWPGRASREEILDREWIVTNGLGGYASGTLTGLITRRFHGLLIAALPSPYGRRMVLNDLTEELRYPDGSVATTEIAEFRMEMGLPVWVLQGDGITLEKRVILPYLQNTVHVEYKLLEGEDVQLALRPWMHFRPHEGLLGTMSDEPYQLHVVGDRYEFASANGSLPPLRIRVHGERTSFTFDRRYSGEMVYHTEEVRGYEARGRMWSPGHFEANLSTNAPAVLVASTELWEVADAVRPGEALAFELARRHELMANSQAHERLGAELVLAADQFLITPVGRMQDVARAHAAGDEVRTVIAGYHWFTDWGRDTMISLEGLTLTTGRHTEAAWILRTFAYYVKNGLIPNMFPEGENNGLYHTADATLWFFHAVDRYFTLTQDHATLRLILPKLSEIVERHLEGTDFGICVDPRDGLLRQGAEGYQLTWMDAKVDGWVVTPRRGKAVEINALWYNALRLLNEWQPDVALAQAADRARASFNERFWNPDTGSLFDIVDAEGGGNDPAIRPNQLLAISLKHAVLDDARWRSVLDVCRDKLLTPVGLRSLAPGHPDYKQRYYGDLRSRDAAYHQGTVWGWLIGPYVDAYLRVYPEDKEGARKLLEGFDGAMETGAIGSLSEIFDAERPFEQRGCIAQAWSVAEVLRCWVKTAPAR